VSSRAGFAACASHTSPRRLLCQEQDDRGRGHGAELERDEHEVPAMDGKRADEQAPHEPHRPGAAANAGRAMLLPEVDYLGHIGEHRDRCPADTEDLKHRLSYLFAEDASSRLHERHASAAAAAIS
jgi:hypothetical protein